MKIAIQQLGRMGYARRYWLYAYRLLGAMALLLSGYSIVFLYTQDEIAFALLALALTSSAAFIFTRLTHYPYRYIFPSLVTIGLFMLFPILYTVHIAFTNYSGRNILTLEQAYHYLRKQTHYQQNQAFDFKLYKNQAQQFKIILSKEEAHFETPFFTLPSSMNHLPDEMLVMAAESDVTQELELVTLKELIQVRFQLAQLSLVLPDVQQTQLKMSGLRRFSPLEPLYEPVQGRIVLASGKEIKTPWALRHHQTGQLYCPNDDTGFYQPIDEQGQYLAQTLAPGFIVSVGWDNFARIFTDKGLQKPFLQIFSWTIIFAVSTVVLTLFLGLMLASVVQWELLKGRQLYRILLILPYAVPAFISILVFKGLFNQNFGEINLFLEAVFGIKPDWFTNPILAKLMILIVNVWLGYPYMMILSMGLLKSIPEELYEASAMDGAGPISNFFYITLPMIIRPMVPLLIATFAFNFNNFVLIQLLTEGKPDIMGASTPAGTTDLLVNYTYRIAFEGGGGEDYGLASAIATLIFLIVGSLSLLNLKLSKLKY